MVSDSGAKTPSEIDAIQYLRAVAALMVVAHHARHYFEGGAGWTTFGSRGVDIFFVISGFIMAHSTAAYRSDVARTTQAMAFLLKRFIRVVPLYWFALLWTAKRDLYAGPWTWDVVADLCFVPHFHRVYTDGIFPALVPGWTINYEMFFYALFAVSLLQGAFRYRFVTIVLVGLVVLGALGTWHAAPTIFYTSSVLLEFLFGIGVWFVSVRWPLRLPRLAAVALTLLAAALLALENGDAVRGVADGPFAALLVWSVLQWANDVRVGWLHRLGDASYSIYLFHLASFWIPTFLLHAAGIVSPTPLHIALVMVAHLASAIAIGLAIHLAIERPLLGWLRTRLANSRYGPSRRLAIP